MAFRWRTDDGVIFQGVRTPCLPPPSGSAHARDQRYRIRSRLRIHSFFKRTVKTDQTEQITSIVYVILTKRQLSIKKIVQPMKVDESRENAHTFRKYAVSHFPQTNKDCPRWHCSVSYFILWTESKLNPESATYNLQQTAI